MCLFWAALLSSLFLGEAVERYKPCYTVEPAHHFFICSHVGLWRLAQKQAAVGVWWPCVNCLCVGGVKYGRPCSVCGRLCCVRVGAHWPVLIVSHLSVWCTTHHACHQLMVLAGMWVKNTLLFYFSRCAPNIWEANIGSFLLFIII